MIIVSDPDRWIAEHHPQRLAIADGAACRTVAAMMEHLQTILKFPGYFGHNWSALEDCLVDYLWGDGVPDKVLVIRRAALFLGDEPEETVDLFLQVVHRAGQSTGPGGRRSGFRVLVEEPSGRIGRRAAELGVPARLDRADSEAR